MPTDGFRCGAGLTQEDSCRTTVTESQEERKIQVHLSSSLKQLKGTILNSLGTGFQKIAQVVV